MHTITLKIYISFDTLLLCVLGVVFSVHTFCCNNNTEHVNMEDFSWIRFTFFLLSFLLLYIFPNKNKKNTISVNDIKPERDLTCEQQQKTYHLLLSAPE